MPLPTLPINSLISGYKAVMDWEHAATSRPIVIYVHPMETGCPNHINFDPIIKQAVPSYNSANPFSLTGTSVIPAFSISGILNVPFSGGNPCPVCKGKGFLYSPSSGTVTARIKWQNQMTDFDLMKVRLKATDFKVRIKVTGTYATDLLDRSEMILVDGNPCRVIEDKISVGFGDIHSYYYYLGDVQ